jgi:hypothetical protein
MECCNPVSDPLHVELSKAFADEVAAPWHSEKFHKDVLDTQRQRRVVHLAMQRGAMTSTLRDIKGIITKLVVAQDSSVAMRYHY